MSTSRQALYQKLRAKDVSKGTNSWSTYTEIRFKMFIKYMTKETYMGIVRYLSFGNTRKYTIKFLE